MSAGRCETVRLRAATVGVEARADAKVKANP